MEGHNDQATKLALYCSRGNHEVIGKYAKGEDFIADYEYNRPDVVLMDLKLKGSLSGLETASMVGYPEDLSFIYLSSTEERLPLNAEVAPGLQFFLMKPIVEDKLLEVIDMVGLPQYASISKPQPSEVRDRIFLREKHRYEAVKLKDIYCIKADRCYTEVFTKSRKYVSSESLNHFEQVLHQAGQFVRVHRSWIVNLHFIEALEEARLEVMGQMIPMGKTYRKDVKSLLTIV